MPRKKSKPIKKKQKRQKKQLQEALGMSTKAAKPIKTKKLQYIAVDGKFKRAKKTDKGKDIVNLYYD